MIALEIGQGQIFCPSCGVSNVKGATQCVACQEPILRDPILIGKDGTTAIPVVSNTRRNGLIIGITMLVVLACGGGYVYYRYHTAQSDLTQAGAALRKDHYVKARALAEDATRAWPPMNVQTIDAQALALAHSAHYYQLGTTAYNEGQYANATADFKRVAQGDSRYNTARGYVKRIAIGTTDLQRVKAAIHAMAAVINDMQNYSNDYNTAVNYSNAALSEYQNGYYYGYNPSSNFNNNVTAGLSALNILQQDETQASTDVATLSGDLGLVAATPTLSGASVAGIDSASQGFINNASQIDTALSSELSSFQNISNGTATQAYGVSSDISTANQGEAGMTTDQNNLQSSVLTFIGYTSGVLGNCLGLTASIKASLKASVSAG